MGFRNTIGRIPMKIAIATAGHSVKRSRMDRSASEAFFSFVTGP